MKCRVECQIDHFFLKVIPPKLQVIAFHCHRVFAAALNHHHGANRAAPFVALILNLISSSRQGLSGFTAIAPTASGGVVQDIQGDGCWLGVDRIDPKHLPHPGLAAWARWGTLSFFQLGHERNQCQHGPNAGRVTGCIDLYSFMMRVSCYGT